MMGGDLMAFGTRLMGWAWAWRKFRTSRANFSGSAETRSGADQMGEIIAGTPGLSQFA